MLFKKYKNVQLPDPSSLWWSSSKSSDVWRFVEQISPESDHTEDFTQVLSMNIFSFFQYFK